MTGVHVAGFTTALIVAVVLGLLNVFIKPILVILTLPITVLTLGLFC
jgi:putative membrane protein